MQQYLVGLDIGNGSIKAAIGELRREGLALVSFLKFPSAGIRKGVLSDLGDAAQALSPVLAEAKKRSKHAVDYLFLGTASSDLKVHPSVGVVAVSRADYEIYKDDIDRAIQSAQAVNLLPNRMVLHSIIQEYIVDGVHDIKDPLGMVGNRLEVRSLILEVFQPNIKNLMRVPQMLGGEVKDVFLASMADARAVLSKNQKELGVVLINIGFGKTTMCVYEEGKLLHAAVFPVGSANITNDLAIGLRIPVPVAEMVKRSFGSALPREISARDTIDLSRIKEGLKGQVSKKFIAEIIEVRLAEILEFVHNDLKVLGKAGKLPAGAVLVGGGAKIPGAVDVARHELKLSVQIGTPDGSTMIFEDPEIAAELEDPEFTTALGLLMLGREKLGEGRTLPLPGRAFMKKILKIFVP
jgi:cell division protein FtsA